MGQNQNDRRSQEHDSKSNQQTEDGRKKETDPNNPTANKGTQYGSQQKDQQRQGAPSTQRKGNTTALDEDEHEEETTETRRTGNSPSDRDPRSVGNQNSKKGNM